MTETKKAFKDWDISDFKDMGSLPQMPVGNGHRPFYGFCRVKDGEPRPQSAIVRTSKLADVL